MTYTYLYYNTHLLFSTYELVHLQYSSCIVRVHCTYFLLYGIFQYSIIIVYWNILKNIDHFQIRVESEK